MTRCGWPGRCSGCCRGAISRCCRRRRSTPTTQAAPDEAGMSGVRLAVPPGRAGRLWLDRRLEAARRGSDLLDRKLRILQAELGDLTATAARTEHEWQQRSAEAEHALLVAALLGGQRAIRLATGPGLADVQVSYAVTIGVRHPAQGSCTPPAQADPWASQPVEQARKAHRAAL